MESGTLKTRKNDSKPPGRKEVSQENVIMTRGFKKRKPVVNVRGRDKNKPPAKSSTPNNASRVKQVQKAQTDGSQKSQKTHSRQVSSRGVQAKIAQAAVNKRKKTNLNKKVGKSGGNTKKSEAEEQKTCVSKSSDESENESESSDSPSSSESDSSSTAASSSSSSSSSTSSSSSSSLTSDDDEGFRSSSSSSSDSGDSTSEDLFSAQLQSSTDKNNGGNESKSKIKPVEKLETKTKTKKSSPKKLNMTARNKMQKDRKKSTSSEKESDVSGEIKKKAESDTSTKTRLVTSPDSSKDNLNDSKDEPSSPSKGEETSSVKSQDQKQNTKNKLSRSSRISSRRKLLFGRSSSCSSHCSVSSFSSDVTKSSETKSIPSSRRKKVPNRPGIEFKVGARLEAKDFQEKWYPAKIVAVDEEDGDVLIHFERWSSRYDEWIAMDSPQLRAITHPSTRQEQKAKKQKKMTEYKVGEEVLARWTDCKMYPAKVVELYPDGAYSVLFYDGFHRKVHTMNMQKMPKDFVGKVDFPAFSASEADRKASSKHSPCGSHPKESQRSASKADKDTKKKSEETKSTPIPSKRPKQNSKGSSASTVVSSGKDTPGSSRRSSKDMPIKVEKNYEKKPEKVETPSTPPKSEKLPSDLKDSKSDEIGKRLMDLLTPSGSFTPDGRRIAPKEFIIEEDHNHFKCDVAGCNKSFRKEILLNSHKKHYHSKNKASGSSSRSSNSPAANTSMSDSVENDSPTILPVSVNELSEPSDNLKVQPPPDSAIPVDESSTTVLNETPVLPVGSSFNISTPSDTPSSVASTPIDSKPEIPSVEPRPNEKPLPVSPVQAAVTPISTVMTRKKSQEAEKESKISVPVIQESNVHDTRARRRSSAKSDRTEANDDSEKPHDVSRKTYACCPSNGVVTRRKADKHARTETGSSDKGDEVASAGQEGTSEVLPPRKRRRMNSMASTSDADTGNSVSGDVTTPQNAEAKSPGAKDEQLGGKVSTGTRTEAGKHSSVKRKTSKSASSKPKEVFSSEIVHCICNSTEEDGLMMQCDICLSWQHAACFNIEEENLKDKYVCYACLDPAGLRESFRYRYEQDWLTKGEFASFSFLEKPPTSAHNKESIQATHQLNSSVQDILKVLHSLRYKLNIASDINHPCLKLWEKPWRCSNAEAEQEKQPEKPVVSEGSPIHPNSETKLAPSSSFPNTGDVEGAQNVAAIDHSYFSSNGNSTNFLHPSCVQEMVDESNSRMSMESGSDMENHDLINLGKRWPPQDSVSSSEDILIQPTDELSSMMNIAESVEVTDIKTNSDDSSVSEKDSELSFRLVNDGVVLLNQDNTSTTTNRNVDLSENSPESAASVGNHGSLDIETPKDLVVMQNGGSLTETDPKRDIKELCDHAGTSKISTVGTVGPTETQNEMPLDVLDSSDGLVDYADKQFDMLEPLSEMEIMEAAAMSEAEILRVSSLTESDVLDVVDMCDPATFDTNFEAKSEEKTTPQAKADSNEFKQKKTGSPDADACCNNLLDHLTDMYEELDRKMDLIEKYVTALESEYGLVVPKSDEDIVEGMPHLKQSLKRFSKDLDIIERMTYFQKEEEEQES